MDAVGNVLWALSSYNRTLEALWFVRDRDDMQLYEGELTEIVHHYVLDRCAELIIEGWPIQDLEIYARATSLAQGDDQVRLMTVLLDYAQALAAHSSFGDAPWRRVVRIIEQEAEYQEKVNELPAP